MATRFAIAEAYGSGLEEPGAEAARAAVGAHIAAIGNAENESWGLEHGYSYAGSPVIAADPDEPPTFDPDACVPSTAPGARLPSTWLAGGEALYDRLGPWFTLVDFGGGDAARFVAAAETRGAPLKILRLDEPALAPLYGREAILVRPDNHVAWRGRLDRTDSDRVLDRALGWDV